jgi:hypothetical protein
MADPQRVAALLRPVALCLLCLGLLSGCGKTGPLYLPDPVGEVVTKPAQAPPPEPSETSNSPQSVDSPTAPPNPAAEVTEPGNEKAAAEKKKEGAGKQPPR